MPVLRGSVTFSRFRVEPAEGTSTDWKRTLPRALRAHAFEPIDKASEEERATGFVELEDSDSTEFSPGSLFQGEYALFGFRVDQLKVSASALRAEMDKWAAAFVKEQQREPSRAERNERRSALRQAMRSRAEPRTRVHDVSWNLKSNQLQVWASSRTAIEEVQLAIESALKVKLLPRTPVALAALAGIPEQALAPTPELIGGDLGAQLKEVTHGAA